MVGVGVAVKRTMYQRKVDVDMLDTVKSMLDEVSSISPSSEQRYYKVNMIQRIQIYSFIRFYKEIF